MSPQPLQRLGGLIEMGSEPDWERLQAELRHLKELGFAEVYPGDALLVARNPGRSRPEEVLLFPEPSVGLYARSGADLKRLRSMAGESGLEICSAHYNQVLPPPGHQADTSFWEIHHRLLDNAALLGCHRVTTHPGWMFGVSDPAVTGAAAEAFLAGKISLRDLHSQARNLVGPDSDFHKLNLEIYHHLADLAANRGITLTLETAIAEWPELTESAEQLCRFIRECDAENMGVCLDTGHCHFTGVNLPETIRILGGALLETHLHDNHGMRDEHLPIGQGTIAWENVIRALQETGYKGSITFEQTDHTANRDVWRNLLSRT